MKLEAFNIEDIMDSRLHAIEESLHRVSPESLRAVSEQLFPDASHPGLEVFLNVVGDVESGPLYHAMADDCIHIIYAHGKMRGMWFAHEYGTGPLKTEQLKVINNIIGRRP
jgi:hypothetical protein